MSRLKKTLENLRISRTKEEGEFDEHEALLEFAADEEDRLRALLINGRLLEIIKEARESFPVLCDPFPEDYLFSFSWLAALAEEDQDEFLLEAREEIMKAYEAVSNLEITLNSWKKSALLLHKMES
jgi:hypothetical protein